MKIRNPFKGFTIFEWCLWLGSLAAITAAHFGVRSTDYLSFAASLVGVTSLIFAARGDPFAPVLFIAFAVMYAIISYLFGYYGEMIIYLAMQLPVSVASLITWLKNLNAGGTQVKVGRLTAKKLIIILALDVCITVPFYFLLKYFGTANLIPSTISVATSFAALALMTLRIPQYALAFILNDIVMIVLWSMALSEDIGYISLVVCFSIFLINDTYTFISWMKRRRTAEKTAETTPDI